MTYSELWVVVTSGQTNIKLDMECIFKSFLNA